MFTPEMLAPCGLDCTVCSYALKKDNPCVGCTGPNENKSDFCANQCRIVNCEKRILNFYRFCDECPDFPCDLIRERDEIYRTQQALEESPIENLKCYHEKGMSAFLREQKAHWTCKECGGVVSVNDGVCSGCGKKYSRETFQTEK